MPKITNVRTKKDPDFYEYYQRRKKVLVRRNLGGLGDIFMHRMIFEDFKLLMPDCHLTFACPKQYFQAVSDHPYIDDIIDCKTIENEDEFGIVYDTSWICNEYELKMAPYCIKHRSDIWAEHCGVTLTNHNMHFRLTEEEKDWAKKLVKGKSVLICPVSAMNNKNLDPSQIQPVIDVLSKDYHVFSIHNHKLPNYNIQCITDINIRQFISIIDKVDYVISVDTAAFHCAGGLGKPTVVIFGWADGKVYSKYYPRVELVQKHRDYTPDWTCGPCYKFTECPKCNKPRKPCITEITADMILEKFDILVRKELNADNN
jgi:ADP-heptose:LPS heptosyltransferase